MWAEKFKLPPNDARLLAATVREAVEHLNGMSAISLLIEERSKQRATPQRAQHLDTQMRTDKEAASFADSPHYTGDPEWDALEAAETDPTREPLRVAR